MLLHRPFFKMRIALHIELAKSVVNRIQSETVVDVIHSLVDALHSWIFPEKQFHLGRHMQLRRTQHDGPKSPAPVVTVEQHRHHFFQAMPEYVVVEVRQPRRAKRKGKALFFGPLKTNGTKEAV